MNCPWCGRGTRLTDESMQGTATTIVRLRRCLKELGGCGQLFRGVEPDPALFDAPKIRSYRKYS